MRIPREVSIAGQYILDEWVPPRLRDSKWFMYVPMRIILKNSANDFMTFKSWVFQSTDKQFGDLYRRTGSVQELQGETDLNKRCIEALTTIITDSKVLEVGCGRGYLAGLLTDNNDVTGCDIVISPKAKKTYKNVRFVEGNIEKLPFKDNEFDVVVTTHTLEHVKDLPKAMSELRRVAKKELIVVVPRQRPYKYTFSLHTQFFPYEWSVRGAFGHVEGATIERLGDWLYREPTSKRYTEK